MFRNRTPIRHFGFNGHDLASDLFFAGLAVLSGLRRGELFALRWRDLNEQDRTLMVREAVYEGRFDTPKTQAGVR